MKKNQKYDVYMIHTDNSDETPDASVLINYLTLEVLSKRIKFSKEEISKRAEDLANELEIFCIPENVFLCVANRLQWHTI